MKKCTAEAQSRTVWVSHTQSGDLTNWATKTAEDVHSSNLFKNIIFVCYRHDCCLHSRSTVFYSPIQTLEVLVKILKVVPNRIYIVHTIVQILKVIFTTHDPKFIRAQKIIGKYLYVNAFRKCHISRYLL